MDRHEATDEAPEEQGPEPGPVDRLEEAAGRTADRLRGSGVGTEDPNIVGEVGPTEVAPGQDPDDPGPTGGTGEESGTE